MKPKKKRPCRHNIGGYVADVAGNVWCFKCFPIRCLSDKGGEVTPEPVTEEKSE